MLIQYVGDCVITDWFIKLTFSPFYSQMIQGFIRSVQEVVLSNVAHMSFIQMQRIKMMVEDQKDNQYKV